MAGVAMSVNITDLGVCRRGVTRSLADVYDAWLCRLERVPDEVLYILLACEAILLNVITNSTLSISGLVWSAHPKSGPQTLIKQAMVCSPGSILWRLPNTARGRA